MFFTIFEIIKNKKEESKNVDKKTNEEVLFESIEENNNENSIKEIKQKKSKGTLKKKKQKKDSSKKTIKSKRKKKIKYKKQKLFSFNINHEHYSTLYLFIMYLLVFFVTINLLTFVFSKGYTIEGTIKNINGDKFFITNYDTLYLNDYPEFRYKNIKENDTIYLIYNKKYKEYQYSEKKKMFGFCLEGKIIKITDYKIEIKFDYDNRIPDKYYLSFDDYHGDTYKITLKKFLGEYKITNDSIKKVTDEINNFLSNQK